MSIEKIFHEAIVKFNGGRGALLCNRCSKTIAIGFDHADTNHYCDECRKPDTYITNPIHGGKVTCYKCNGFILESEGEGYLDHQHKNDFPAVWFHKNCFNHYEHYYGLDKPID